jgi:IS605 OrfB family transposase
VRANDTMYHEDLQVRNMLRYHHLAKSIQDAGWSAFLSILAYKAAYAGKQVNAVAPAFTSRRCSGCGVMVQKGLSVRWHACPDCGTSLHRDHNAALDILTIFRRRAGPCREAGGARGLFVPVARPWARRTTQYGERKSLLCGPGTVRSGRAGPSGANGVGRHRRRLSIPLWGVSI